MHDSLGARLRQHRQRKGVSLKTIAQQTKIKQSLLEGLERDDVSHWPVGIFRRAYVREYAQAIGLDPDPVVREFVERYPAPVEVPEPPAPPPSFLRNLFDSARESLVAARSPASAPDPRPVVTDPRPPAIAPRSPDLLAAARLCTELGRVEHALQVLPLLRDAAGILDARGLIVWVWDALSQELKPALTFGYPAKMLTQVRGLKRDADNATADAFRSAEARTIAGALVVPLLTPAACAGVLAIELSGGTRPAPSVMAIATILAAMLAQLVGASDVQPGPG